MGQDKHLLILKFSQEISIYLSLKNDVAYYDNNKNLFTRESMSEMTGLDEEYFINIKDLFEREDEKVFWKSFFVDLDPSFYKELLLNFKRDKQRREIILGLKLTYESMNESFQKDFIEIYKFLLDYWKEVEIEQKEITRIKWEDGKLEFVNFIVQEYNKRKSKSLAKFVKEVYPQYEFPSIWDWTENKCLSFVYKVQQNNSTKKHHFTPQ